MSLRTRLTRLGSLNARVVDDTASAEEPSLVVVLCHGFGAPGDDLVDLAAACLDREPSLAKSVRFVFPEALLALGDAPLAGRAWWPIDMVQLQRRLAEGIVAAMRNETPAGLGEARRALLSLLDAVTAQTRLPRGRIVLGGFSQGAMLATDVALRWEEAPAALAVLSGTLVCEDQWQALAPRRRGLDVLLAHGRSDPLLPFAGALALQDLLSHAGLSVRFVPFAGGHGIDDTVLRALSTLLVERCAAHSTLSTPDAP
jgi:phospholipase/carboxylesterase